jgi:hypothetical protein
MHVLSHAAFWSLLGLAWLGALVIAYFACLIVLGRIDRIRAARALAEIAARERRDAVAVAEEIVSSLPLS